jgi:hypothetical protein
MRDKVQKADLAPFLRDQMRERRAAIAREFFSPEAVREACCTAAGKGYSACLIKPPSPVNLRATDTVKALEGWLAKQGLASNWVLGRDTPDGVDYPRLEISW